jgi:hypothetical protein
MTTSQSSTWCFKIIATIVKSQVTAYILGSLVWCNNDRFLVDVPWIKSFHNSSQPQLTHFLYIWGLLLHYWRPLNGIWCLAPYIQRFRWTRSTNCAPGNHNPWLALHDPDATHINLNWEIIHGDNSNSDAEDMDWHWVSVVHDVPSMVNMVDRFIGSMMSSQS